MPFRGAGRFGKTQQGIEPGAPLATAEVLMELMELAELFSGAADSPAVNEHLDMSRSGEKGELRRTTKR